MKKQNKHQKTNSISAVINGRYKYLFATVTLLAIGYLGYVVYAVGWSAAHNYRTTVKHAGVEPIRTMVLDGVEAASIVAPVDAKTGDIYFPPAKLYLPANKLPSNQVYRYSWDVQSKELSIVDERIYRQAAAKVIGARSVEEMFDRVPHLQACARGVIVSEHPAGDIADDATIKDVATVGGRQLTLSAETACAENAEVVAQLKDTLQAY